MYEGRNNYMIHKCTNYGEKMMEVAMVDALVDIDYYRIKE